MLMCVFFHAAQEVVLGDLKPDTSYSVSVGAYTAKGDGARSKPVTVCSGLPREWSQSMSHIAEDLRDKASIIIIKGPLNPELI